MRPDEKQKGNDLRGLILTGGKSTRMKTDKAALVYDGMTQTRRAFDLLSDFCEEVFVSTKAEFASLPYQKDLPQIHDHADFADAGPLAGILSAMAERPDVSWLILACDLPFVSGETIRTLIEHRNSEKCATAYISARDGLPEPLCAIYEPGYRKRLEEFRQKGMICPRKAMINSDVELIQQHNPKSLDNINTPEDYRQAAKKLGQ